MANLPKFRKDPLSIEEMLDWGMISKFVYERAIQAHSDFYNQKKFIEACYGYQTWVYGKGHIKEILSDVDCTKMSNHDIILLVLKTTRGKVNPNVVKIVLNELKAKHEKLVK